jgi:uroporphyrinogen decarboxylase
MGVPERPPLTEPRADWIRLPVPEEDRIRRQIRAMNDAHPDRYHLFELGLALFERAWTLRGMENLLVDMIEEPAFVDALLESIADYDGMVIDIAADEGIDGIMLGDDWGQQRGLIMGLPHWRRFIRPHIRALYGRIRGHGLAVFQHSCGDNRELLGDLIDLGLDVYNTFQPEIYDAEAFAQVYGRHLAIYGGISTQGVMRFGTPDEVRGATLRMMDLLGPMGYIASPTHQVSTDIPVENILAFQQAVVNQ